MENKTSMSWLVCWCFMINLPLQSPQGKLHLSGYLKANFIFLVISRQTSFTALSQDELLLSGYLKTNFIYSIISRQTSFVWLSQGELHLSSYLKANFICLVISRQISFIALSQGKLHLSGHLKVNFIYAGILTYLITIIVYNFTKPFTCHANCET